MFFTNEIQKIEINSLDDLFLDLEEYKKIKEKNLLEFKIQKIQENILNKINNKSSDKIDLIFPENNTKDLVELISDDYNELALKETEFIVNDELSDEVNESDSSIDDYYGKSGERKDVKVINNVNEECLVSDDCEINLEEYQKENSLFTKKNKK